MYLFSNRGYSRGNIIVFLKWLNFKHIKSGISTLFNNYLIQLSVLSKFYLAYRCTNVYILSSTIVNNIHQRYSLVYNEIKKRKAYSI